MGIVTVYLCLIIVLGVLLYRILRALRPICLVKETTNIPGPPSRRWPIIGDALWIAGITDTKSLWRKLKNLSQMKQKIMSFYLFSKLMIFVNDAELLQKLAKKCPSKDEEFYGLMTNLVGTGLVVTTDEERWSFLRQAFNDNLRKNTMEEFIVMFANKAEITCEKVRRKCGQGVFDMSNVMQFFTLDITLEVFLGYPGTQQLEDTLNILPHLHRCISLLFLRIINPLLKIEWIYQLSSIGREMEKRKAALRPKLQMLVDQCTKQMLARGSDPNDPNFEPNNYLEALIQNGLQQKLSHEETLFSICDIIIAGFDTTGTSISGAILMLAMHPDYQERAYQEQLSVMGDSLRAPTRAEMSEMKFLDMVLSETLRVVGVPAVLRVLHSETIIDDYVMPEGASIYVSFHNLGSDPRYWEKPKIFYPDHFSPENVAGRPKYSFLPFSFGKRGCPGQIFGMLYSKLILSMFLRRFRFTSPLEYNEISLKYKVMLEIEQGYPVEATSRINTSRL